MPGEPQLEFLLLTPLTPAKRDNMIAWLAARADPPHYGQLVVFKLPKDRLVLGPAQIEATIDQDTTISRQLTLWDQRGSRVIRGHLLVIPIDDAFLYVEPVYLRAEDNEIPQLQRVIVSDGSARGDGAHAASGARGRVQRRSTRRGLQSWIGDRSARRRASVGSRCAGGSPAGAAQGRLGRVRQCDAAAERNPRRFIHTGRRLLRSPAVPVDRPNPSRILRLALLAPDIVEAILGGWADQRVMLESWSGRCQWGGRSSGRVWLVR